MSLLDRIEEALQPLRAELTTSCVLCGQAVGPFPGFGRVRDFCICQLCFEELHEQMDCDPDEVFP